MFTSPSLTAGEHFAAAEELLHEAERYRSSSTHAQACALRAQAHLAAAQLLLTAQGLRQHQLTGTGMDTVLASHSA